MNFRLTSLYLENFVKIEILAKETKIEYEFYVAKFINFLKPEIC
ncbi:hypothetical protein SAMN03080601_03600 [Alkalitalea saponilacus]|uniref:Uncharacterized protein n=1 Tax=Alkalitalea saponilacus TaxID=889453 RepID=A0A1T5HUQ7_9BACT|nr:hypothetical protein SAMN03080601_03600 [Alkalitalea saponilacus]